MNRTFKNASWIIGCKIVQSLLGIVVSLLSARYLGPSDYGLIQYASSLTTFVVPIVTLGFNGIIVYELVSNPENEGEILGTALISSVITSILSILGLNLFVYLTNPADIRTITVCGLFSISLFFSALELIQYWYQSKLLSKYSSVVALISYLMISVYRIFLLATGKSVYWFSIAHALDIAIIACSLLAIYRRLKGKKMSFSMDTAKRLLEKSKYYIVSNIMVTVMTQTDRIMLKHMISDEANGWYAAAALCTGMTSFVFTAIADSFRPTIFEYYKKNKELYEVNIKRLYSIFIYLSLAQSIVMTMLSRIIIFIMYGNEYMEAHITLKILAWYTAFSCLGIVRNIWLLSEGKERYVWSINMMGAIANIALNFLLIPLWRHNGAAIASLITQFLTNVLVGFFIVDIKENNRLMLKSINPKILIEMTKAIIKR